MTTSKSNPKVNNDLVKRSSCVNNLKSGDTRIAVIEVPERFHFIGDGNDWGFDEIRDELGHKLKSISLCSRSYQVNSTISKPGPFGIKCSEGVHKMIGARFYQDRYHIKDLYKEMSSAWPNHFNEKRPMEVNEMVTLNKDKIRCDWKRASVQTKNILTGKIYIDTKMMLTKFGGIDIEDAFEGMYITAVAEKVGGILESMICPIVEVKKSEERLLCGKNGGPSKS